jgi:hypothetical protein
LTWFLSNFNFDFRTRLRAMLKSRMRLVRLLRKLSIAVDGSISSGCMFSPNVRDSLVAILRLSAMPSSSATAVETGELKLMADVGDSGEWVVLGMLRGTLGSRTINTRRKLWRAGTAGGAAALEEGPMAPAKNGVSPKSASNLRADRMRRFCCA